MNARYRNHDSTTPDYWQERALQAQVNAEAAHEPVARHTFRQIAMSYNEIARSKARIKAAEQRAREERGDGHRP